MKYGIAIFPSKEVQDIANSYRKRYDPHYSLIPPHVTLKEAFEADDDYIQELIGELRLIASETKPFPLIIKKISSFSPVTNTVYLKVEPVEELMELNEKLHQGKFTKERTYAYVPHITIGQKLSDDEHSDVYGSLRMQSFDIEEQVDRFQLLYQLENGAWTVYETFKFGGVK
ncbi:2'-5' RNA ligase [Melghiribacillus thermohalophilus]|uniref:Putative phosphoesterase EDD68_10932 n=1 Tax=Melghiribacillus thermohalophilus TaxID=1324956 RepID=A0A4R3N332_9BACI|nr:YjcG family protein [Melghiribacillus thermohalophilus]TCT22386.1 2'-5' RNA ligase [Melghiribacillus thermohalophilus]